SVGPEPSIKFEPPTTLCAYVNHKVTLCKPITRSKAISCAPITFNRATQTLFFLKIILQTI
ncbi:unnamed protein product, partial [Rotaria magnacalcarata]